MPLAVYNNEGCNEILLGTLVELGPSSVAVESAYTPLQRYVEIPIAMERNPDRKGIVRMTDPPLASSAPMGYRDIYNQDFESGMETGLMLQGPRKDSLTAVPSPGNKPGKSLMASMSRRDHFLGLLMGCLGRRYPSEIGLLSRKIGTTW
jgi:hypothetical protein